MYSHSRRRFLARSTLALSALGLGAVAGPGRLAAAPVAAGPLLTRPIPSSGELLPVIGAGTSGSYEVELDSPQFEQLKQTVKVFFDGGGTVFDTSPNYRNADEVLGALLADGGEPADGGTGVDARSGDGFDSAERGD